MIIHIATFRTRLPHGPVFHDAVTLGKRFTAAEALASGIVHKTCPGDDVIKQAVQVRYFLLLSGIKNTISWTQSDQ